MPSSTFPCDDCGKPPMVEIVVSREVWAAITKDAPAYCLCADDIDKRLAKLGLFAIGAAFYHGSNLRTELTPEQREIVGMWRLPMGSK